MAKPNAKPNAIATVAAALNVALETPVLETPVLETPVLETPVLETPAETVSKGTLNTLVDAEAQKRAEALSVQLKQAKDAKAAADKEAADKVAEDNAARLALAQQELVESIKSLSVDKNVVLANVIRTYRVYGNDLKPVSLPSKLAGSTEGKVLTWVMENPEKLIALNKAVTTDNATKTSDQITAKVIAVIKAHITVKPYAACF